MNQTTLALRARNHPGAINLVAAATLTAFETTLANLPLDEATARKILAKLRARTDAETTLAHTVNVDYTGDQFGGGEKQSHVTTARRGSDGVLQTVHYDVQVGGKKAIKKHRGPQLGAGKKVDLPAVMEHMLGELPVAQHVEPLLIAGVSQRRTVHPAFH